jgi:hypothetical protein
LTSGICDAFAYGNALVRVIKDGEDDSLLTACAKSRRDTWLNVTNEMSQGNLNRLRAVDTKGVAMREGFFNKLNSDPSFPAVIRGGLERILPHTFEAPHPMYMEAQFHPRTDIVNGLSGLGLKSQTV